ncbi:MAG: hypothetical protein RR595_09785 [Lysinibacillus sp.]
MNVYLLYKMTCGHPERFELHDVYATYELAQKAADELRAATYIKTKCVVEG